MRKEEQPEQLEEEGRCWWSGYWKKRLGGGTMSKKINFGRRSSVMWRHNSFDKTRARTSFCSMLHLVSRRTLPTVKETDRETYKQEHKHTHAEALRDRHTERHEQRGTKTRDAKRKRDTHKERYRQSSSVTVHLRAMGTTVAFAALTIQQLLLVGDISRAGTCGDSTFSSCPESVGRATSRQR